MEDTSLPKSVAIWYADAENEINIQDLLLELHLNLWRIGQSDFADFGLKIIIPQEVLPFTDVKTPKRYIYSGKNKSRILVEKKLNSIRISQLFERSINLHIYFPFKREILPQVINLIDILKDENVYLGIFNKPLAITAHHDKNNYILTEDEKNKIYMYNEGPTNVELLNGGILVKYNSLPLGRENCNSTYIRFRLPLIKDDNIFSIDEDNNFFDPMENHMNSVSITINEFRNIEEHIKERIYENQLFRLMRVDYFAVRGNEEEIKVLHKSLNRCREVELDKWDSYIGVGDLIKDKRVKLKNLLAYHWKESTDNSKGIDHFYAYSVFFSKTPSQIKIFTYLILILLAGALSGVLGNILTEYIGHHLNIKLDTNFTLASVSVLLEIFCGIIAMTVSIMMIFLTHSLIKLLLKLPSVVKRLC